MRNRRIGLTTSILWGALTTATSARAEPGVERFWLVDATTNTRIRVLADHESLALPLLPTALTIEAEATLDTQSVEMRVGGVVTSIDNDEPYGLYGSQGEDLAAAPSLQTPGWIQITAAPFGGLGGTGSAGPVKSLSLQLYQPDFVVTNPLDLHDAQPGDGRCSTSKSPTLAAGPGARTRQREVAERAQDKAGPPWLRGCTLRAALEEANALAGTQSILVDGTRGPFVLTQGELVISDAVTIRGHEQPLIDARHYSRVLWVDGEGQDMLVNLSGLDLTRGDPGVGGRGGALAVLNAAHVQARDCIFRDSRANYGGGIDVDAARLTLFDCAVRDNEAGDPKAFTGGGITQRGGGLHVRESAVQIIRSAIFDNMAVRGGGISNSGGTVQIESSVVADNEAAALGGGIENHDGLEKGGHLHLAFTTIVHNRAGSSYDSPDDQRIGGGLYNTGRVYLASSILADNSDAFSASQPYHAPDCYSPEPFALGSFSRNVIGVVNAMCAVTSHGTADATGTADDPLNPGLLVRGVWDHLVYYSPGASSIAIDNGASPAASLYPCKAVDLLGRPRPVGKGCDIGSIERQ